MEYGLIGSRLGHSYSKIIHERLCGYAYQLHPLPTEAEARRFLEERPFRAINVTIPYKRLVMEYCDWIDPRAAAIGAVNTVVNRGGRLYGSNTDYDGFAHLCKSHGVDFAGRTVLLLHCCKVSHVYPLDGFLCIVCRPSEFKAVVFSENLDFVQGMDLLCDFLAETDAGFGHRSRKVAQVFFLGLDEPVSAIEGKSSVVADYTSSGIVVRKACKEAE